jgi:hypothetical protein
LLNDDEKQRFITSSPGLFVDADVNLFAVATTLVRIGGGCVTEQQLTSDISSGFVGRRISASVNGFDLTADDPSAFNAFWSIPVPPNGSGADGKVEPAVVTVAGLIKNVPGVSVDDVAGVAGTSS